MLLNVEPNPGELWYLTKPTDAEIRDQEYILYSMIHINNEYYIITTRFPFDGNPPVVFVVGIDFQYFREKRIIILFRNKFYNISNSWLEKRAGLNNGPK